MPIRVITIEREFGTGAANIAELVAARLGWTLWDKAVTAEIARIAAAERHSARSGLQRQDPLLYRLAKVFARGSYERSIPVDTPESQDAERLVRIVTRAVEQIGARGQAVIVGRGAAFILREHAEAFHVFVFAPYEEKLRRVVEGGKGKEEAMELLDTVDLERAAFVKQYTGRDWPNRYLYN